MANVFCGVPRKAADVDYAAEIREIKETIRIMTAQIKGLATASPRDAEKTLDNGGSAELVESGSSADAERTEEARRQLSSGATWAGSFRMNPVGELNGWACCGRPYTGPHADHCSYRDIPHPGNPHRPADEKAPAVEERQGSAVDGNLVQAQRVPSPEEQRTAAVAAVNRLLGHQVGRLRACLRDIGSLADRVSEFMPSGVDRVFARGIVNKVNRALRDDGSIGLDANPEPPAAPVDHATALGELRGLQDGPHVFLIDGDRRRRFRLFGSRPLILSPLHAVPVPLAPENADTSDEEAEERDDDKVPHGPV